MRFLPAEDITYKTRLTGDEILRRISENTEPEKKIRLGLFGGGSEKIYEGYVGTDTFQISRIITYRNSFLPKISGVIDKGAGGTRIRVKMRLKTFVILFLCVWCTISGFVCIVTVPPALNKPQSIRQI